MTTPSALSKELRDIFLMRSHPPILGGDYIAPTFDASSVFRLTPSDRQHILRTTKSYKRLRNHFVSVEEK